MNILYLINGLGFSNNTGIGGSDKRAIEIIRNLKVLHSDGNYDILTTDTGYKLFKESENLQTRYYTIARPKWWLNKLSNNLVGRVISYFYAFFKSLLMYKNAKGYDIYFASSDFFFDVIPAATYSKIYKKPLVCMVHHHIKNPFKRGGSLFINFMMYLSQRFSISLIKILTNVLFLYDTPEGKAIANKYFSGCNKISKYYVKNGIDTVVIDNTPQQVKIYEACFLGGIRFSKGIREFTKIWKIVTKEFKQAKFLVIGGGSNEIVNWLKKDIKDNQLEDNIILTGPLSGMEVFENVKKCKLFLFPSHEEGWGIVLCEAMYSGLPVICYDLPAFSIFGNNIDKHKIGDYKSLAQDIIHYLKNQNEITKKGVDAKKVVKDFTWENIADKEYLIFKEIVENKIKR